MTMEEQKAKMGLVCWTVPYELLNRACLVV